MHPYLSHLLADIAAAHRSEPPVEPERIISFEEEMEEVERWLEGSEPAHTFGYYCGLELINFPPPQQLTKQEMEQVVEAFTDMMSTWNLSIDLPKSLPIEIAYSMTIETLNRNTDIPDNGFMSFDFCTGYAPGCIFKEFCPCLSIWNNYVKE